MLVCANANHHQYSFILFFLLKRHDDDDMSVYVVVFFLPQEKKNKRKKTILWVFSLFAYVHMGVYSYSIPASKHKVRRRDYHTQGNDSYSHLPHSTVLKAKRLFMRVNRSFHACCCYDVLVFPLYIFFLFSFTTLPPRPYRSGHSFIMH